MACALLAAPATFFVVAMMSHAGSTISSAAIESGTTISASNVDVAGETVMVTSRKY